MNKAPDYFLLDAARMGRNFDIFREKGCHYECLYEDRSRDDLAGVAPYLAETISSAGAYEWMVENGTGNSWGVFIYGAAGFDEMLNHFRKFLVIKDQTGGEQYFRFYDPRVLKIFLPACDKSKLTDFFGPVEKFIAEGDNNEEVIEFWQSGGVLEQKKIPAGQLFDRASAS